MYNDQIFITGSLVSNVAITPEQLACIEIILKENDLGETAVVSANNPEAVRIEFDYVGWRGGYRNPINFAFAENVARVVETCEEINLGLVGEVIIRDLIEDTQDSVGTAYKVIVAEGKGIHIPGLFFIDEGMQWRHEHETLITVRPKRLDFG